MNATHDDRNKTQARAALAKASATDLATDRDRRIHGWATAGFGLAVGTYVALNPVAQQFSWLRWTLLPVYVATLMVLATWQSRAARTVPRHSRIIGYAGLAGTGVLTLAAIIWLNVRQADNRTAGLPDELDAWWVYAAAGLVAALPMLVAGYLIHRGRK